uniref:Uncharacterized protein n=1 Tax=Phlebotomus papatasi TaxID=29031 RepID=A0A1B0DJ23_PHLPP
TFSHSDLSSEISAAISSDHLVDSPPAASPPLGPPPDFEPPATMPTDDASHTPDLTLSPYSPYTNTTNATYAHDEHWRAQRDVYKVPDVTTKSLSGLENLVDQIPTMGDVDGSHHHHHHHHHQVTNGTIEGGDTMRGDESTNYPSCLYSDRDYESVFAPYGGASYAAFAADSIDVPPPPPPPPAYAAYTSGNFDYTYPGQHPGFGPTPQAPPSPQMVLNPNYAAYAATSYPPPPYPPPPQAQSTVSYRHHAFKPDITGYGGF